MDNLLGLPIVTDDRVPLGEVWLASVDAEGEPRVDKLVNLNRECGQGAPGGCELGLEHPGDCLVEAPPLLKVSAPGDVPEVVQTPRRYLVIERGTGRVLRVI